MGALRINNGQTMTDASGWGRGHRLLYVVNESFFFYSHRMPIARAARDAGFDVHVAAPDDHVWAAAGFDVSALEAEGLTFHVIPLNRRGLNPFQDLRTMWALWQLYRRLRPALLHHLTIKPVLYGGIISRALPVRGVVNAVTGLGHLFTAREPHLRLLRWLIVRLYRAAMRARHCRVIVQNADDGEELLRVGAASRDRLHLVRGSGVDMDEFPQSPEADGTPLVILPARMIWAKGIGEFVEAARNLRAEGIDARFAILGDAKDGYPGAVPRHVLQGWHDAGVIEWWGRRENMPEVFKAAHVVCLPTKYGEGVPRVLIEAAACGRAAITSDVSGCRDIVRHEENGLLVPPGDVAALTAALRRLLTNSEDRRRLAAAGRRISIGEFAESVVIDRTMAVYRELLQLPAVDSAAPSGAASASRSSALK